MKTRTTATINPATVSSIGTYNCSMVSSDNLSVNGGTPLKVSINTTYTHDMPQLKKPTFDTQEVYTIDDMLSANIHYAIARHSLYKLACKGNQVAMDILSGINNGVVTLDDLAQEVAIAMIENYADTAIESGQFNPALLDDIQMRSIFGAVSSYMYKHQTRVYKKQYVTYDIDGQDGVTLAIDNARALSDISDIDKFCALYDTKMMLKAIADKYGKNSNEARYFALRVNGYTMRDCATSLSVTFEKIRTYDRHIKKVYADTITA